ncbi:putative methyltransferase [Rosa sericea]
MVIAPSPLNESKQSSRTEESQSSEIELLSCPVCYEPLIRKGPPGLIMQAIGRSSFDCKKCYKSYSSEHTYLDLTVTAGLKKYVEVKPVGTELFRRSFMSFIYEKGYRQYFRRYGFPGPDEEFKMAQDYFKSTEGGVLVDVSCGSGLFAIRFAKSGTYSGVVALDFSENMLLQCYDYLMRDPPNLLATDLVLVRADVSRLPFTSCSVDAVHAGAALHCWPSPSNAVAEITRVLRSGGIFVGTTFLRSSPSSTSWIFKPLNERVLPSGNYFSEEEIEDLCTSCGLTNYSSKVEQSFIIFSAQKP